MLQDQALWIVLAESTCQESEFELAQPFLFGFSDIIYLIEPYMETVGYEGSLLVFDQCGVIAMQYGLITYFSYNDHVWDMGL
jgi:hypothetical protein